MNIYIVPAWYPEDEQDIYASFFREQARALSKRGHHVDVIKINTITCKRMFSSQWHAKRFWQDGQVRVFYHDVVIPCPKRLELLQEYIINHIYAHIINQHLLDDKKLGHTPDLIHAHVSLDAGFYCVYASQKNHLPLVVTEHYSGLLMDTISKRDWEKVKYTIEHSNKFIFVGKNFQKKVCSQLKIRKKTLVIPNMVDIGKFKRVDTIKDHFTILCAGHLNKNKSINLIIEAFKQAFGKDKNVELVIAGDGVEKENLIRLADQLGLSGRTFFKGKCSRKQMTKLFAQSQLFVLTSKVESFGVVYIEAIASGVPIIGTKGQGAEDIVNGGNGLLVEHGNIHALGAAMRYVYEHYVYYKPKEIRQDCIQRFSEDSVCRQIEEVYKTVLRS